jgi:hypothetical protein
MWSPDKIEFAAPTAERRLARYFDLTSDGDAPEPVRTVDPLAERRINAAPRSC